MKIMCAGDHHWDRTSRWEECLRIHQWMFERAVAERIDLFISAGDIYDRASTPEERLAVAEWAVQMAEQCPCLFVRGNHDTRRDLELLSRLESAHPITVEEGAGVHYFCHSELAVAAVAWPERARILARAREQGLADSDALAQDCLQAVFRDLGMCLGEHKGPTLAVGHFMVDGAKVSTGQPLIGQAMNVGLADLALLQTELVLMGHIHMPQQWRYGSTEIVYTGSPYRTAFGETEAKGVVLVELDERGHTPVMWRREWSPCTPMLLLEDEWDRDYLRDADGWGSLGEGFPRGADAAGAEIRFRYAVAPDKRDAARVAAELLKQDWLDAGAVNVQIEECVRTSVVARAPEVAQATTLPAKLLAMWAAKGTTPESPRKEALLDMAAQLESEIA